TEERQAITQRLAHEGIETDTPIVVIHPGTGAAVKLWRVEAWSAIANALPALVTSPEPVRIILTGSKSEQPLLAEIAQGITNPPLLLTDLTVGQLAALLQRAKMVLGVDNGPLHLAVAQNTPTLHIFGPTDPRIFGPWGSTQRHVVLASTHRCPGCPCIPCGRLDFSPEELPQHPCVRLITEQQVINALSEIIQSAAPAPGYP
ncbi:MAG TPA: glycosyltransferase family 9 protein, partial [Ktedonobacteraceae bacterium]|nr:glycosyltransferase family 9 protein [Ktedonobacteraceae bacterium]